MAGMFGMEMLSIYGVHQLFVLNNVDVAAEFAMAFALARPFRRLRFPIEVGGAAFLIRLFPSLKRLEISNIAKGIVPEKLKTRLEANANVVLYGTKMKAIVDT